MTWFDSKPQDPMKMHDNDFKRFMQFSSVGISEDAINSVVGIVLFLDDKELIKEICPNMAQSYEDYLHEHKPEYADRTISLSNKDKISEFDLSISKINEAIGNGVTDNEQARNVKNEIQKLYLIFK